MNPPKSQYWTKYFSEETIHGTRSTPIPASIDIGALHKKIDTIPAEIQNFHIIAGIFSLAAFHEAATPIKTKDKRNIKVSYFYLLIPELSTWDIDLPTRIYDIQRSLEALHIIFAVPTPDNIEKQLNRLKPLMTGGRKRRTRRRTDAAASRRRRTIRRRK